MSKSVLLLTNHGNEPYLLGISVALKSGAEFICVPHYYHGRKNEPDQKRIIQEEFKEDHQKIFLSQKLGDILSHLLRSVNDNLGYPQYVEKIYKNRNGEFGINHVFSKLEKCIAKGLCTSSISPESTKKTFRYNDFEFALNIGLPIDSPINPTYYIFTALMSQVYRTPLDKFSENILYKFSNLADYWEEIEAKFTKSFIPRLHALSHSSISYPNTVQTPPLADYIQPSLNKSEILKGDSVLIIPSATGNDNSKIENLLLTSKSKLHWVSYSPKVKHVKRVKTSVFADKSLMAVISRGGWGTVWKCLIHTKPMGLFSTSFLDDPEIAHTIKTLLSFNIGFLIEPLLESNIFPNKLELIKYQKNILKIQNYKNSDFVWNGIDYKKDGIGFIGAQLNTEGKTFST